MQFEWNEDKARLNMRKHGFYDSKACNTQRGTMREEYDLKTLKVKRRGILPSLEGQSPEQAQVKITITLDDDLVDYFKADSEQLDTQFYQTQINQTLRPR